MIKFNYYLEVIIINTDIAFEVQIKYSAPSENYSYHDYRT